MNRRQKIILSNTTTVIVVTAIAVAAMINLKNWVNRSESMRAMENLGRIISQYRGKYSSVPPESYIGSVREELEGHARLGKVIYRASGTSRRYLWNRVERSRVLISRIDE